MYRTRALALLLSLGVFVLGCAHTRHADGTRSKSPSPASWANAGGNYADATPVRTVCRPPSSTPERDAPTRDDVMSLAATAKASVAECGRRYDVPFTIVYVRFSIDGQTGGITWVDTLPDDGNFQRCVAPAFANACTDPFVQKSFKVSFPYAL